MKNSQKEHKSHRRAHFFSELRFIEGRVITGQRLQSVEVEELLDGRHVMSDGFHRLLRGDTAEEAGHRAEVARRLIAERLEKLLVDFGALGQKFAQSVGVGVVTRLREAAVLLDELVQRLPQRVQLRRSVELGKVGHDQFRLGQRLLQRLEVDHLRHLHLFRSPALLVIGEVLRLAADVEDGGG